MKCLASIPFFFQIHQPRNPRTTSQGQREHVRVADPSFIPFGAYCTGWKARIAME